MKFQDNIPIYVQIANDIKRQIIAGALPEGEKLLSIREYSGHYAVTALTMQRALALMESEKIIHTKKGVGSFVMANIQDTLKRSMLKEQVQAFIAELFKMGLTGEEIITLVKEEIKNGEY